jgi:hypothetical protein
MMKKTQNKLVLVYPMATIGRNTHLMAATSGIQHTPGPAPLIDACGIARC